MSTPTPSTADSRRKWRALPGFGRGDAGATAVVESLRVLAQLAELEVDLEGNKLGPGLGGLCQSILDLATQTLPQARRRRKSSGPPSTRCRCVGKKSIFDPRPRPGPGPECGRGLCGRLRGLDSGCEASASARWWWPFSRALRICRHKSRGRAVVESEHSNLSP